MRPRDAATLVLLREAGGRARVLMGRRDAGHVFMPEKFVFPGGRLDRADHRIRPLRDLRPDVAAGAAGGSGPARARALALAAVRETFEETGLVLGRRVPRPRRSRSPAWRRYFERGVAPSLERFEFVARAVTPPGSGRRYDARFFLVRASEAEVAGDLDASLAGDGELHDLTWVPVDEARRLDLPTVTHLVIEEVARRLAASAAERKALEAPFWRFRGEEPLPERS